MIARIEDIFGVGDISSLSLKKKEKKTSQTCVKVHAYASPSQNLDEIHITGY